MKRTGLTKPSATEQCRKRQFIAHFVNKHLILFSGFLVVASMTAAVALARPANEVALAGLGGGVKVYFDNHDIPHIYAKSWPDAARVLGYLHAGERLRQMDLFRRQGDNGPPEEDSGGASSPVGRPDFKSGRGREPVLGGFDSHSLPPPS